ncbi:arsinothricin resistance N-acetyltransferase ArsN1 family B [Nostoc sp. UHCC 0251]|uniref:arsinothricin resistance N-acetyltransferase ArsN1 family B n=1 Tax=Nostoc sp. UHCC 0251 TaxID=3110240 RepID=UPI002B20A738|nr:arsinothricin resistance N-acetyltransferase ArsN1 family B [Nostoc sp. UHCC 0251]MEA5624510.1 arsinothricin resistance N-acetyltransferase ArsN1 family B [Nostoc sp. UHCC 0251]
MKAAIRLANESDALKMLAIYAPIVRETAISFEIEPPSKMEFQQRIQNYQQQMPWLVCEIKGELLGYAYTTPYRTRAAYQWSVESSVYVNVEHRRKGVAKALYTSLFRLLQLQGYYNVFAAIALPNSASVAVHEAIGFSPVSVFRRVGYKFDEWHDVGWWQLSLQQKQLLTVNPPLSLLEVQKSPLWNEALESGLLLLRV